MHIIHSECCVCRDTKDQDLQDVQLIDGKWICLECVPAAIIRPFEAALQHEINYPPRWGYYIPLELDDFADAFTDAFAADYRRRIQEYETPVQLRVYCQVRPPADGVGTRDESADATFCNQFMGQLGSGGGVVECERCNTYTCLYCRLQPPAPPEDEHFCKPPKVVDSVASFDPETRGKEWQQCPNLDCLVKLALGSGCNAMRCHFCDTEFCMICGARAAHNSGHWTREKGCPRWNGTDDANAMFDDDPVAEELDIVVGMVMLPRTDFDISAVMDFHYENPALADKNIMTTVWENFVDEMPRLQWAACENDTVLKLTDDMRTLLHDLVRNLEWAAREWARRGCGSPWSSFHGRGWPFCDPAFESTVLDPVMEAVESVNFMIRHQRLSSRLLQTLRTCLELAPPSASFVLRGSQYHIEKIFARYWFEYEPEVAKSVRLFVKEHEDGRTLFVRKADRVDRRAGKKDLMSLG